MLKAFYILIIILSLYACDGGSTASQAVANDVGSVTTNTESVNHPPTISGIPASSVESSSNYSFTPSAADSDDDKLSFSARNLPSWASFNASNGTLSGIPSSNAVGIYSDIVISVTDGSVTVSLPAFSIHVASNTQTGGSFNLSETTQSVSEGSIVNVTVTRSNDTGEASIMYGTNGLGAVSSTVNGDDYQGFDPIELIFADGEVSKAVSIQTLDNDLPEDAETFEVYLTSPSNGYTLGSNVVATVTIIDNDGTLNQPPMINGTPETNVTVGTAYSFIPISSDPNNDNLTFSVTNLPGWATFDTATGAVTGTPNTNHIGIYEGILITVSDGMATASLDAFTINISDSNHIPLAQHDAITLDQNGSIIIDVLANDSGLEDGLTSLTVITATMHGSLQTNSDNTITYTPDRDYFGLDSFTYKINDGNGDSAATNVTLTINCLNNCVASTPDNTFYVREGATGNNTGTDWLNAYTQLPESLERGATYLIADGNYTDYVFDDSVSGTEQIQIRKATIVDHGTNTGWESTYGDGQATFRSLTFTTDNYIFDGVEMYGFKVKGDFQGFVINVKSDNVFIKFADLDGNFAITNGYQTDGVCNGVNIEGSNNTKIEFSKIHNIADDGIGIYGSNNINLLSNQIYNLHGCGTDNNCGPCYNGHSDGLEISSSSNLTLSGNLVFDIESTSGLFIGAWESTPVSNLTLINNIFYTPATGIVLYLQHIESVRMYNNIVWGRADGNRFGGLSIGQEVRDLEIKNNIILNINYSLNGGTYDPVEHDIDNNLFAMVNSSEYTTNINDIIGDPLFANISVSSDINQHIQDGLISDDFLLLPGSPGIDTGLDMSNIVDTDINRNKRPQDGDGDGVTKWDIGSIEINL